MKEHGKILEKGSEEIEKIQSDTDIMLIDKPKSKSVSGRAKVTDTDEVSELRKEIVTLETTLQKQTLHLNQNEIELRKIQMKEMICNSKLSELELSSDDQLHQVYNQNDQYKELVDKKDSEITELRYKNNKLQKLVKEKEANVLKFINNQKNYKEKLKEVNIGHSAMQDKINEYQDIIKMLKKQYKVVNKRQSEDQKSVRQKELLLEKQKHKILSLEDEVMVQQSEIIKQRSTVSKVKRKLENIDSDVQYTKKMTKSKIDYSELEKQSIDLKNEVQVQQ